jgi:hypothetical protein
MTQLGKFSHGKAKFNDANGKLNYRNGKVWHQSKIIDRNGKKKDWKMKSVVA